MKKFWILNIILTLVIFLAAMAVNHKFYLTNIDFYSGVISSGLLMLQVVFCIIYTLRYRDTTSFLGVAIAVFAFIFQIMSILFIVNGILWNTDTGGWSYLFS